MPTRRLSTAAGRITVVVLIGLAVVAAATGAHRVAVGVGSCLSAAVSLLSLLFGWGTLLGLVGNTALAVTAITRGVDKRPAKPARACAVAVVGVLGASALLAYCLGDPWVGHGPVLSSRGSGTVHGIIERVVALATVALTAAATGVAFFIAFSVAVAEPRRSRPHPVPESRAGD